MWYLIVLIPDICTLTYFVNMIRFALLLNIPQERVANNIQYILLHLHVNAGTPITQISLYVYFTLFASIFKQTVSHLRA